MKQFNLIIFICALLAAVACSEETDLRSKGEHFERLAVEAVLTDQADRPQRVILSRTLPKTVPFLSAEHWSRSLEEVRK